MLAVPLATCCERPIPKMLWIEHIRTKRDILGEADARHCQPPGAWRIVVHDLSPFDRGADPADDEYPDKPPRMRWATYNRLMDRLVAADAVTDERLKTARAIVDQLGHE
jgi:hypothetical protein